jgi:hypothetical protein
MEVNGSDELFSVAMVSGGRRRTEGVLLVLEEGERGHGRLRDNQHLLAKVVASCCVAVRANSDDRVVSSKEEVATRWNQRDKKKVEFETNG